MRPAHGAWVAVPACMPKDDPAAYRPRLLLADLHEEIDAACADLRACVCGDDARELIAQFRAFERTVIEYMEAEEATILDEYEQFDADDAQRIRRQHAELRGQLLRLAVDAELHCLRAAQIDQMIAALRAHAAHENARMYLWAQVSLSPQAHRALFMRIGRSLRELARSRARYRAISQAETSRSALEAAAVWRLHGGSGRRI